MKLPSFLFFVLWVCIASAQSDDREELIRQYYNILNKTDLVSGMKFYQGRVQYHLSSSDTINAIQDSRMVAIATFNLGMYDQCEQVTVKALEWALGMPRDTVMQDAISGLNNQLGEVYRAHRQYERSLTYYKRALEFSLTHRDSAVYINNIALTTRDMGELEEAVSYFEQAYRMSLTTDDTISWARTLDNWGYAQSMAGNESAVYKMEEALDMRLQRDDLPGLYASYFHLAEHYIRLGDTLNAMDYAEKAKAVAYRMNAPSNIQDALNRYLRLSGTRETKRYIALNDSLQKATQEEANRFAALRYDAVSAEARAKEVELEAERQRRSKLIYQATGALVVLSAIFLFILFRNRHKREKAAQVSETEARISKKVHDEVANDIHLLLTQLESSGKVDEVFLQRLDEVYNRTRNISKEVAGVDPDTNFGLQLAGLLKTYRSEQVQVITRNLDGIDWEQFDLLKKNTLYRVVQELMTNMRKHSKASVVALIFEQEGKRLSVSYRDNGVGAQLNDKGGLQNTENRMEAVGGTISFETEPGKGFNAKLVL